MTVQRIDDPSTPPEEIAEFIREAKSRNHTVTLIADCEVEYEGRAASDLAAGERLIILKPDGVVTVHRDEKVKPVNWQPSGTNCDVYVDNDIPWIEAYRKNPDEIVIIALKTVYSAISKRLEDNSELELTGTEKDVVEKILENPELIEEGFRVVDTEWETGAGPVDVFGKDKEGTPSCVEVKRGTVSPANVMQLHRYIESVEEDEPESTFRAIIVGGKLSDRAETVLNRKGYEFRSIKPDVTRGQKTTTLDEFTNQNKN